MTDSFELFSKLASLDLLDSDRDRDRLWWPNAGSFEVVLGAMLTQQTKWERVEKSLSNLKEAKLYTLESISNVKSLQLAPYIKPSGFYNTKAKWLVWICKNILKDFGDFDHFKTAVTREWLLDQKGVGEETADSILCYCCFKDEMVVDTYTTRLLSAFGYEMQSYEEIKEWMQRGIYDNASSLQDIFAHESLYQVYAYFHGLIVQYCKNNSKGKLVSIEKLGGGFDG